MGVEFLTGEDLPELRGFNSCKKLDRNKVSLLDLIKGHADYCPGKEMKAIEPGAKCEDDDTDKSCV